MTDQKNAAQAAILALMLPEQPGLAATVDAGYAAYRRGYNSAIGDAARVLSKLRAEGVQAGEPTTDAHTAFATWWNDQDEGSIRFDLEQYPQDLKATFNNLWNEAWRAALAAPPNALNMRKRYAP